MVFTPELVDLQDNGRRDWVLVKVCPALDSLKATLVQVYQKVVDEDTAELLNGVVNLMVTHHQIHGNRFFN
jgi:hypothetical protein